MLRAWYNKGSQQPYITDGKQTKWGEAAFLLLPNNQNMKGLSCRTPVYSTRLLGEQLQITVC